MNNLGDKQIRVSVSCLVYNHAPYLRQTLDGFVNQKTNFDYEVLVHDDASSDGSVAIIKEYEELYPDIIKPIYQEKNQYSLGVRIGPTFQFPRACGDYIAMCEGDDYWVDEYKLQKQFDYMEANPDCTLCFTNAYCEESGKITRKVIPWQKSSKVNENGRYDLRGIEEIGYIPTASFFYRLSSRKSFPIINSHAFQGDGFLKLALTMQGYAYCISSCTCVYRLGVPGSITTRWKDDKLSLIEYADKFIVMYQEFNRITGEKYADLFLRRILEWEYSVALKSNDYEELRKKKYWTIVKNRGGRSILIYGLACCFPRLYRLLKKIKT